MAQNEFLSTDSWFNVSKSETSAEDEFSKRVGYLGGYALGYTDGISTLEKLYKLDIDSFQTFYSEVARIKPSQISIAKLSEFLARLARNDPSTVFKPLPKPSHIEGSVERLYERPPQNLLNDTVSFAEEYGFNQRSHDSIENAQWPQEVKDTMASCIELLSPDSDVNKTAVAINFSKLFDWISLETPPNPQPDPPPNPNPQPAVNIWIGSKAVNINLWQEYFAKGSENGKQQSIVEYALRYIIHTIENASRVDATLQSDNISIYDHCLTTLKQYASRPADIDDEMAQKLINDLGAISRDALNRSNQTEPSRTPENLNQNIIVSRRLVERFGSALYATPVMTGIYGRKIYRIEATLSNENYAFEIPTPFVCANLDRIRLGNNEKQAISSANQLLGSLYPDLNDIPCRNTYNWKHLLEGFEESEEIRKFLINFLPNPSNLVQVKRVEQGVEILNPAYVLGICAAFAIAVSWEGNNKLLGEPQRRITFYEAVEERIRNLILNQTVAITKSEKNTQTPLEAFNISYVMGLRSLQFFAKAVSDKAAMDQGATVVIKHLSQQLPQFFTNAPEVTTVESALEFVDRGAIMVYRCLDEQNKRIAQLTQDVANYSQKIVDLERNIISANDTIKNQNGIISDLSLELGKIQDEFNQFTKLTESIKAQLEKELENARKEINELSRLRDSLQATVEETKKRLQESEALLRVWKEVGESSKDTAEAMSVLLYATTGFLIAGPVGSAAGAFFGEDIIDGVSKGKSWVKKGLKSASKTIKSWFS